MGLGPGDGIELSLGISDLVGTIEGSSEFEGSLLGETDGSMAVEFEGALDADGSLEGATDGLQVHHLIGRCDDLEPLPDLDLELFDFELLLELDPHQSTLHQSHDSEDDSQFQLADCVCIPSPFVLMVNSSSFSFVSVSMVANF